MNILITGSKGQLGRELTKACIRRKIENVSVDVDELDIADLQQVRKWVKRINPYAIVNCAAYTFVDQAESDFERACLVNGIGPKNLAIAAEEQQIPIMHFSTDYVFDGCKGSSYTICDQPNPINRYGESKWLGERMVASVTCRYYVIRLSWVFGCEGVNFPRKLLEWAHSRSSIKIVTDQISSPTYTVDLIEPIFELLNSRAYGLYHLSNGGSCSRYDWGKYIFSRLRLDRELLPVESNAFPSPARRPHFSAMDSFPLQTIIGKQIPSWQNATDRFLSEIGVLQ